MTMMLALTLMIMTETSKYLFVIFILAKAPLRTVVIVLRRLWNVHS
jgi:hypothetical protein